MNLVPDAPTWLLAILFAALAAAAIEDFIRLRISNITCAVVFVAAITAMVLQGFSLDLWQNLVVFLVLLTAGTLLFAADKIGGGDVKLLAALGLWVDIGTGVWLLVTSLIAGGIVALIYIVVRQFRGGKKSKGIPYALAIVSGAGLVLGGQAGWMTSKPQQPYVLKVPAR
jgi:prepilin peptidase CpaA